MCHNSIRCACAVAAIMRSAGSLSSQSHWAAKRAIGSVIGSIANPSYAASSHSSGFSQGSLPIRHFRTISMIEIGERYLWVLVSLSIFSIVSGSGSRLTRTPFKNVLKVTESGYLPGRGVQNRAENPVDGSTVCRVSPSFKGTPLTRVLPLRPACDTELRAKCRASLPLSPCRHP